MADLIDRQALLEWFKNWSDDDEFSVGYITGVIEDEPSAQPDLQPTCNQLATDCISRQAAIDVLEERLQANGYSNADLVSELNRSIGYLMRLPSADTDLSGFSDKLWRAAYERGKAEAVRWISCSERLPAKKTEVIYSLENHYVSTGYMTDRDYNGDEMELHWEDMESGALIYPEAWMPLPKPYEGSE